jgi:elongation factor P
MLSITHLRKGTAIELDGHPYVVIEYAQHSMGRGGSVVRTKIKSLINGAVMEKTFKGSDKIIPADVVKESAQFLYKDANGYHFMNDSTYEQVNISEDTVGADGKYLVDGATALIMMFNGSPIGLDIGNNVFLKVAATAAGAKGDTATTALKPATLETGIEVMVPLFIREGDIIKVDTRDGKYLERKK